MTAKSLRGRIDSKSFGDRVVKGRPHELDERLNRSKKKKQRDDDMVSARESKRPRLRELSVLTDMDDGVYQPQTRETRAAYEAMLNLIQQQLGGQPLSIICGAADEVLALLKNESVKNHDKKMEIEKLLSTIPNQVFDQLVAIGKRITDYQEVGDSLTDKASEDKGLDYDVGVALEFEEDDDETDLDMVQEEIDEEDEDATEPSKTGGVQVGVVINGKDGGRVKESMSLNAQDIDAYWLQRKIYNEYERQIDPQECQALVEELLRILSGGSGRDVENKLVEHLQFEKFSLVKFLLQNRLRFVWCTRLARARDQEERNQIEEEMMGLGPELAAIVEELHAKRATAKEREEKQENNIKEEARRLVDDDSSGDGDRGRRDVDDRDLEDSWLKGQRQVLDLESLAFNQGGFPRKNKKCELHDGSYRISGKEFDEVHVPWVPKKFDSNEKLMKISDMPDWAQPAFRGMQQLNRIQSKVYDTALFKAENILLCAPTGAGKTNVAVLTILQQLHLNRNPDGTYNHGNYKIVYVAPMKALVVEVVDNLSKRLKDYGVTVKELSGDQSLTAQEIKETQIIVTTPEKWDIITA